MDWAGFFEPSVPIGEEILRGSLIYLGVTFLVRLFGQRETGSLSITDLIVIVLISEAVSNAFANDDNSITGAFILVVTILVWSIVLDALAYRFPWFRKLLKPGKKPLIENGKLDRKLMRRQFLTQAEIEAQLRLKGLMHVEDVERAYMEPNGEISVFAKQ